MSALRKYLARYCEPEATQLSDFHYRFQQGLVIPVYREHSSALNRFIQFAEKNPNTLLILVINRPDSDCHHDNTYEWANPFLEPNLTVQWQSHDQLLTLQRLNNQSGLLTIDRCHNGAAIPKDQGVGLARKIGADVLCALIAQQQVESPWIANTDADALLPEDYFPALQQQQAAVLIYPYRHIAQDEDCELLPTLLYEFSLHYYVAGLRWAGSSYAYHTLGSTITVHYQHYAQVRGFPKRSGAEDFYLLNKLAKTGNVVSLEKPLIELQARESTRVPFGTGPAVKSLGESQQLLNLPLYHPNSFYYLKQFLQNIEQICQLDSFENMAIDNDIIQAAYQHLNTEKALQHCFQHGANPKDRLKHFHAWFDSFRTLKFIHFLREHYFPSLTYQDWRESHYTNSPLNSVLTPLIDRIDTEIKASL
jgi:hypothetical protein